MPGRSKLNNPTPSVSPALLSEAGCVDLSLAPVPLCAADFHTARQGQEAEEVPVRRDDVRRDRRDGTNGGSVAALGLTNGAVVGAVA